MVSLLLLLLRQQQQQQREHWWRRRWWVGWRPEGGCASAAKEQAALVEQRDAGVGAGLPGPR